MVFNTFMGWETSSRLPSSSTNVSTLVKRTAPGSAVVSNRQSAEIRLAGQGGAGVAGGSRGDLYLKVTVEEHPDFRREGNHIVGTVTVNAFQAMLGSQVTVSTPAGDTVSLRIPTGTQPGTRLRLKGLGSAGGDHFVELRVSIPSNLTPTERERLTAFASEAKIPL